ncbi:MAG: transaldolase [Candidatus Omnitrophota bacterium]|nr:MAG: transaldolase [Candidatus Omnitrophota bacterium]
MHKTKIVELSEFGQSIWLDYISRSLIEKGKLQKLIELGLMGMTSNPTIFDKAISSSNDYDEHISELYKKGKSTFEIYDILTVRDVQDAADILLPVYKETEGLDGYVSLEVNPTLAYKPKETIKEAKRLYQRVDRPNVMFKVPATSEGFGAIEALLASGININATLIFSLEQYTHTVNAYMQGLRRFLEKAKDATDLRSVASVFVSRIDTLVDRLLEERIAPERDERKIEKLAALKGKAAVNNCSLIYKKYLDIFSSEEFRHLAEKGVHIQRVLWGSTSTKNFAYSDIKYVNELIGKNTVNTMPQSTFEAFLDHGEVKETLTSDVKDAEAVIGNLKELGIDIDKVCAKLLEDGVVAFQKSFISLLKGIEIKVKKLSEVSL